MAVIVAAADLLIVSAEIGAVYAAKVPTVLSLFDFMQSEARISLFLAIGALLADIFVVSPLRAGVAAYHWHLADGRSDLRWLRAFYRNGAYGRAVRWRLTAWGLRIAAWLVCFLPGTAMLAWGNRIDRLLYSSTLLEISRLYSVIFGLLLLLIGFCVAECWLLRYMPTPYFLEQCPTVRQALRLSRQTMKGHLTEMIRLYIGYAGWLFLCVLIVPYPLAAPIFWTARAAAVRQYGKKRSAIEATTCFTLPTRGGVDR